MNRPFWVVMLTVGIVFAYFLLTTAVLIWAERRVVARMQSRRGPNRVGPFGILQTLVDGVKMFFKEDVTPAMVKQPIYTVAPLVAVVAGFLSVAVIPIGGDVTIGGETFPLQVADLGVGMLWFLAMGSLHVYATFLGGWASNSPYPLLGGGALERPDGLLRDLAGPRGRERVHLHRLAAGERHRRGPVRRRLHRRRARLVHHPAVPRVPRVRRRHGRRGRPPALRPSPRTRARSSAASTPSTLACVSACSCSPSS